MSAVEHIKEIEAALSERPVQRDDFVVASWRRCVEQHGLDPTKPTPAYILPERELRHHQQQAERLTLIARSGLEDLFRQVASQNYVLLLTDAQGITVDYFGDANFEDDLRASGLFLGSAWSEAQSGTNGIGACIATGRAVTVHQKDHFDLHHVPLSCSAAPIYDLRGSLAAVLDVSLLRSPQPKATQALALHMVKTAARRIELANLTAEMSTKWVLRLSRRPDFVDVDPDGALAVDDAGTIIGATRQAQLLLRDPSNSQVVGRSLTSVLDLDLDDLPTFSRIRSTKERCVFLKSGDVVYAHAIAPQPRVRTRRDSKPSKLSGPFAALHCGDWNVEQTLNKAERLAQNDLPIWITGASGTGKERLARAIHSKRDERAPFVVVQCADYPGAELETILFGTRGDDDGLITHARDGVLFLDAANEMSAAVQSRLARALTDDGIRPANGANPISIKAKIISASTMPISDCKLRDDLMFRLGGACLDLPNLDDRADIDGLVDKIIRLAGIAAPKTFKISDGARSHLRNRSWPGNIRELKNTLRVSMALSDDGFIDLEHIPQPVTKAATGHEGHNTADLERCLDECGWNISRVARLRGVDRTTIHRQMKRAGITRP
ncbi:sigma-54-dependent Fis family transcriptional regulator [Tateyamaria omphalii]|uniref:sigma-54-dependent Fis family transcriptional regulator n=1 Tax=Tateyamaria omphalii TaxID=299262 RepID=UPI001673AD74|nr:sigma-54-dependent Fis family transcriptional regulator [Tateyamaria omphalii]GGX63950.1 sigma-54-dependent Fis family transcriptional regulator [Tateyamaria omphalii]